MAKKFYAVKKGLRTGIFESWDDCKAAVTGYSNAEYKGFSSEVEARAYLTGTTLEKVCAISKPDDEFTVNLFANGVKDGNIIRVGVAVETIERTIPYACQIPINDGVESIHAELLAVMVGVLFVKTLGYCNINVFYKYEGVYCWYNKLWNARGIVPMAFVNVLTWYRVNFDIKYNFEKIQKTCDADGYILANKLSKRTDPADKVHNLDTILKGNFA